MIINCGGMGFSRDYNIIKYNGIIKQISNFKDLGKTKRMPLSNQLMGCDFDKR